MEAVRLLTQERDGRQLYGFDGRTGIHFISVPIWANGGEIMNKETTESRLHLPPATEGLQSYADMWAKLRAVPDPANWQFFNQGHIGMVLRLPGHGALLP